MVLVDLNVYLTGLTALNVHLTGMLQYIFLSFFYAVFFVVNMANIVLQQHYWFIG
jgi:EamA domain-containing membrane protein RarD